MNTAAGTNARANRAAIFALVVIARSLAPCPVHAQVTDEATAAARDDLIRRAQDAAHRGDHAEAVDLARRAIQLRTSVSMRRFMAEEIAATGDAARALGAARQCIREAASGDNRRDLEHGAACTTLAQSLEPRVARLVVRVPRPLPEDVVVTIGDAPLPTALWGQPYFVNPGTVVVRATGATFAPYEEHVDLAAGASVEVAVRLHPIGVAPVESSPRAPEVVARPEPIVLVPPPARVAPASSSGRRTAGIVLASLGGVAVAAGAGVMIAASLSGHAVVNDGCMTDSAGIYGPDGVDCAGRWNGYQTMNAAGIGTLAVGGVLLVTGIVLAVLPGGPANTRDVRAFHCAAGLTEVACGGAF